VSSVVLTGHTRWALPLCVCGGAVILAGGCATAPQATHQSQQDDSSARIDDLLRRFNDWTNPSLSGSPQAENQRRWMGIVPGLTALFSPDAIVTVDVEGRHEEISPDDFSRRIARAAFTSGPRQIILHPPARQTDEATTHAVIEQYLLDRNGPEKSSAVHYELTIETTGGGGDVRITRLNVIATTPTAEQTAAALRVIHEQATGTGGD
jgi:hypothetical protein